MASFSQLRLAQLSGSFGTSAGQINDLLAPLAKTAHSGSEAGSSLADHLSHVVSSIKRIHGASEFGNATAGEFSQTITPSSDAGSNLGSSSKEWGEVHTNVIASAAALDVNVTTGLTMDATTVSIDGTDDSNLTVTGNASGTKTLTIAATNDGSGAGAIDVDSDGAITIDAGAGLSLDAAAASNLSTSSGDLTLEAGGSSNKVVIKGDSSSGVAVHIDANEGSSSEVHVEAGVIDLDASAAIEIDAGAGLSLDAGAASNLTTSSGALTLDGAGGVSIAGNSSEVDITTSGAFDVNVGSVDLDSTAGIAVDGTTVSIDGTDDSNVTVTGSAKDLDIAVAGGGTQELRLASAGTGASALHLNASAGGVDIDSADMITLDAADEITLTTSSADGHVSLVSAHTAGVAIHLDGDAAAGSIVDIDAGILDVDVTGVASIDSGGTLSLATANSGVAVSIGHSTSEVTVNDNLTVAGDLTVNGATTTLDTTNLLVEDPMILFGSGSASSNSNGGIALLSGSATANQSLVFGRVANDVWGFGKKDVQNGSVTTLADMTLVTARASKFEVDGSGNHIDVTGDVLTLTAGTSFEIASAADIVLDGADVVIDGNSSKLEFGSAASGEHITGDGTDLTIASGAKLNLSATSDVILPDNVGMLFGDVSSGGEKIEGNGTKLTISSSEDIDLTATTNINIPANVGLKFGDDADGISANSGGTITIAAGALSLDSEGDITLDADGADIILSDGGTESARFTMAGTTSVELAAQGDIILDPAGNNVLPGSDSTDSLGSDATSASHSAGSSQSGLTSGLTSGQSFSMSGNNVAILYGSSLSAPSGGSAPSGLESAIGSSVSLSSFSSTINGTLTISNSYSGSTISAGTILSLNGSSSSFFFVVLADYSGGSSMSICAMANVSGHTTSIGSVSSISSYSSSGFSGSGAISGVSVSADDVVAYTFSGGTAIFEAVTAITSSTPWGFVANPNADVSGLSTFSSSGSPSSVTSGGTITAASGAIQWKNLFVDSIDLNGQGKIFLDADKNCMAEGLSTGLVLSGNVDNAASIHLKGYGMTFTGGDQNDSFYFENSALSLEAITEPSTTTGKLYNVSGDIFWNGSMLMSRKSKSTETQSAAVAANDPVDISGMSHDQGKNPLKTDVYLNGQLMVSGSTSASGDYSLSHRDFEALSSLSSSDCGTSSVSTSTTSLSFSGGLGSGNAAKLKVGTIIKIVDSSSNTFHCRISSAPSGDSSTSLTVTTVKVSGSGSSATVSGSTITVATVVDADEVVFHFGIEVDDVVTVSVMG